MRRKNRDAVFRPAIGTSSAYRLDVRRSVSRKALVGGWILGVPDLIGSDIGTQNFLASSGFGFDK